MYAWPMCPAMQAGADPNAEDQAGARPIDAAACVGERRVVELLLPITEPSASGEWTADWLLEHAEPLPHVGGGHQCDCGHSHEHGDGHAHEPDSQAYSVSDLPALAQYMERSSRARMYDALGGRPYGPSLFTCKVSCMRPCKPTDICEVVQLVLSRCTAQWQVDVPEALEPDADAAAAAKRCGDEAFVAADFPAAVAAYTRALRHDTHSHVLWANRSAAALRTGDYEAALDDARIARTINPVFTKARIARLMCEQESVARCAGLLVCPSTHFAETDCPPRCPARSVCSNLSSSVMRSGAPRQAWYREGCAARELGRWGDAAQAFFSGYQTEPTSQQLAGAFKDAVERGKQAHAAAQAGHASGH